MNGSEDRNKSYAGRASIDMSSIVIMVDAAPLAAYLSDRYPLTLRSFPEAPAGKHPVCIELWCVRDGRPEASGIDLHEWSERSGGALGAALGTQTGAIIGSTYGAAVAATMGGVAFSWLGPLGALWGASAGFVAGATSGGLAGASAGGSIGEEMLRRTARQTSELAARALGTYHEAALLVPNVVRRDASGPPHQFVLGMLTDSALSKYEAEAFGQGFGKRMAKAHCTPFEEWLWTGEDGETLLAARFAPGGETPSAADESVARIFQEWTRTPFLGVSPADVLAVTDVDRCSGNEDGPSLAGGSVVWLRTDLCAASGAVRYELGADGSPTAAAFHARNALVRVSRPRGFEP